MFVSCKSCHIEFDKRPSQIKKPTITFLLDLVLPVSITKVLEEIRLRINAKNATRRLSIAQNTVNHADPPSQSIFQKLLFPKFMEMPSIKNPPLLDKKRETYMPDKALNIIA